MNKKLLKQIVNERRSNSWLFIELLLVSIVLWYVVDYMFVTPFIPILNLAGSILRIPTGWSSIT